MELKWNKNEQNGTQNDGLENGNNILWKNGENCGKMWKTCGKLLKIVEKPLLFGTTL